MFHTKDTLSPLDIQQNIYTLDVDHLRAFSSGEGGEEIALEKPPKGCQTAQRRLWIDGRN